MNSKQLNCIVINPFAGNGRGKKLAGQLKKHPDFINAKTIGIYVSFKNEVDTIYSFLNVQKFQF